MSWAVIALIISIVFAVFYAWMLYSDECTDMEILDGMWDTAHWPGEAP